MDARRCHKPEAVRVCPLLVFLGLEHTLDSIHVTWSDHSHPHLPWGQGGEDSFRFFHWLVQQVLPIHFNELITTTVCKVCVLICH